MSAYAASDILGQCADKLPGNCRRVVVDIACGNAVVVYYECYGDGVTLEILKPSLEYGMQIAARKMTPRELEEDKKHG